MKEILKLSLPRSIGRLIDLGMVDKIIITQGHREVTVSITDCEDCCAHTVIMKAQSS